MKIMDITVCIGSSCHLKGSREIIGIFEELVNEHGLAEKINLRGAFCMGRCQDGVCVGLGGEVCSVSPETAREFFETRVLEAVNR